MREALFLHVWLRRQEIEVNKIKVLAQGFASGAEHVSASFKEFINSVFPFQKGSQKVEDKKLLEAMRKEVARGPLTFTPVETNMLKQRAATMAMPDAFRKKLTDGAMAARRRRLG